jgi:cysteine desulfurase/selenocysteine lyase
MSPSILIRPAFNPAALKCEFPGLADPGLHYLDNAATAQMPEAVLQALRSFEINARANVHEDAHHRARAATAALYEARSRVASFLHAYSPDEVVFTYGTTSSINLLAHAFMTSLQVGDEILLSVLEHHSNLVPWQRLAAERGLVLRFLPITEDGRIDLSRLDRELSSRCRLVAITHCSNVTGSLTDVSQVVGAAHQVGSKVLLDGAQRAPHGPLDMRMLDVDFYAFSGHKTYGPTGIGVLWGRRDLLQALPPFLSGGQMVEEVTLTSATFRSPPRRFEAGTPPIAAAIGLGTALDWMQSLDWRAIHEHEMKLTSRMLDGLSSIEGVRVLGPTDTRDRRGVVSFCAAPFTAAEVCHHLDGYGVALRGGHHCAQPLIRAFGVEGAARASLGPYTLESDIDALLTGLDDLVHGKPRPRRGRPGTTA